MIVADFTTSAALSISHPLILSPNPALLLMPTGSRLRASVLAAKTRLAEGREKLRAQHDAGSPGIQVCARLTDVLDGVVLDIYEAVLADLGAGTAGEMTRHLALVANGGYGRRDVAPFSDVDLMLLHSGAAAIDIEPLARRLSQDLYDVGLSLGFSVRTPREACRLAMQDAVIFTSLVEARYLAGSVSLFTRFFRQFRRQTSRRWRTLIGVIEAARRKERSQYGETVYLLEPNVKRSRGALRDLQLIRWIGFARHGECEPSVLERTGDLLRQDHLALRKASEFLLRLRNELHFHAGKSYDLLDRGEQVRLAALFGYAGQEGILPVEQFMSEYFQHTSGVRNVVGHFVAGARPTATVQHLLEPLLSHQVEGDFRVGPMYIGATRRGLEKVSVSVAEVLRLMDLANLYGKRIDHRTWETIRSSMTHRASDGEPIAVSDEARRRFLSLLSQPWQLGTLLRRLHELRVLEKLIPGFSHARCLLQFNEYHKYTVDEHSIRAVECATEYMERPGPLGQVYRSIQDKRLLHLALLVHDLGKGFLEDHSEVGLRLAEETANLLQLGEQETETLKFLVHKHLMMSHLAFRRDTSDEALVVRFAVDVGSPNVLRMLFVLTCADLEAVGPGVLNQWKLEVLTDLFRRAMLQLAGDAPSLDVGDRLQKLREQVRQRVASSKQPEWFHEQIDALPASYLYRTAPEQIAEELGRLHQIAPEPSAAIAWGRYLEELRAVEYTIGTYEQAAVGIFHRLTGALASQGLQILSAEINTLAAGLVLDRFLVTDADYSGEPPSERIESVSRALVTALASREPKPPTFRKVWQVRAGNSTSTFARLPTRIRFDNSTSQRYTIIDVFAHDRLGLLYTITRTLYLAGLSVHVAKIGTYIDQVVDVFYVTDNQGAKVADEQSLHEIRQQLLEAIDSDAPAAGG